MNACRRLFRLGYCVQLTEMSISPSALLPSQPSLPSPPVSRARPKAGPLFLSSPELLAALRPPFAYCARLSSSPLYRPGKQRQVVGIRLSPRLPRYEAGLSGCAPIRLVWEIGPKIGSSWQDSRTLSRVPYGESICMWPYSWKAKLCSTARTALAWQKSVFSLRYVPKGNCMGAKQRFL